MNLSRLGFPQQLPPLPTRVLAPAPRATKQVSVAESAHVTRLLGALLNLEDSARFLEKTPNFSNLLRDDLRQLRRIGAGINARMMVEFEHGDAAVVDTMNACGNLLNRLSLLICHCPPDVADAAANAAADVVERWHTPPKPRKARRVTSLTTAK